MNFLAIAVLLGAFATVYASLDDRKKPLPAWCFAVITAGNTVAWVAAVAAGSTVLACLAAGSAGVPFGSWLRQRRKASRA